MLRVQCVIIDDEDGVRGVYAAQLGRISEILGVTVEVVGCKTLAEGEVYVRAPLPQTRKQQTMLEPGEERAGQIIILDGTMPDGDTNSLAEIALEHGKHLVRSTGTPHVIPNGLKGYGILYKPSSMLVFVNLMTTAFRAALGM